MVIAIQMYTVENRRTFKTFTRRSIYTIQCLKAPTYLGITYFINYLGKKIKEKNTKTKKVHVFRCRVSSKNKVKCIFLTTLHILSVNNDYVNTLKYASVKSRNLGNVEYLCQISTQLRKYLNSQPVSRYMSFKKFLTKGCHI